MITVKIERVAVEPGNALIGPDRVHVITVHGDWVVPIARGGGDAYAKELGPELLLETAQITEPVIGGPVTVELAGGPDYPHKFRLAFELKAEAEALLKTVGFALFRHVRPQKLREHKGKPIMGMLPMEGVVL